MRKAWLRLQAWLRREAYVREMVAEAAKRGYLEGHAAGIMVGQQAGYQVGCAHGELQGRQALSRELQAEFGVEDNYHDWTLDAASRIRLKQVH